MDKLNMQSPDFTEQNIQKLAELFPNCVTEAKNAKGELQKSIDFDLLKQELSANIVEGPRERYQLNWPGKREALLTANTPISKTLRPCREESVDFDNTENLFIEGDNLDALKLLQETYLGKVKMIYIDPPYNTGKDFIYSDNFTVDKDDYDQLSEQKDEDGGRLVANTESNGRFHSDWLDMMYPRLKLARNLLRDDGVIFISIDDNEVHNLRKVCDEVFGSENYVNIISMNMKNIAGASGGGEDKRLKKNIEFILVYVKSYRNFKNFKNIYDYMPIDEIVSRYRKEGKSWKYTSILFYKGDKKYIGSTVDGDGNEIRIYLRKNPIFKSINQVIKEEEITEQEAYCKYSNQIFEAKDAQSSIRERIIQARDNFGVNEDLLSIEYVPRSGRNKGNIYEQFYKGSKCRLLAWLRDVGESIDGMFYKKNRLGTYWDATSSINNLTKEGAIQFINGKKPVDMLKRLLIMQDDDNCIVLDFFAGSASTAHAVMEQNDEDGGNRKYILIQIPEVILGNTKENKKYLKYLENEKIEPIVTEISKERIRRAGKKILEELKEKQKEKPRNTQNTRKGEQDDPSACSVPSVVEKDLDLDIGFRVLKVDSSNMKDVYYAPDAMSQGDLIDQADNIKEDRSAEDLLFQVLLDWGVDLTLPIVREVLTTGDKEKPRNTQNTRKSEQDVPSACSVVEKDFDVFFVDGNALAACFDSDINEALVKQIAKREPLRAVFRDAGYGSDSTKINIKQIFKLMSPHTEVKAI